MAGEKLLLIMNEKELSTETLNENPPADALDQADGLEPTAEPLVQPIKAQKKHRCSNPTCMFKNEVMRYERINFGNSYNYFCEKCADAIRKKWVCHYCRYISVEGDTQQDHTDWVQCDFQKCGRWTHVDCEQLHGFSNIRSLLSEQNTKYYCPVCRNLKNFKKQKDVRMEPRKIDRFSGSEDYRKAMLGKKRVLTMNYIYLHSESYQSIEKLLSGFAGGSCSLMLKEPELAQDLKYLNLSLGKTAFDLPTGIEKSTSSKLEDMEKRNTKKFAKKAIKT